MGHGSCGSWVTKNDPFPSLHQKPVAYRGGGVRWVRSTPLAWQLASKYGIYNNKIQKKIWGGDTVPSPDACPMGRRNGGYPHAPPFSAPAAPQPSNSKILGTPLPETILPDTYIVFGSAYKRRVGTDGPSKGRTQLKLGGFRRRVVKQRRGGQLSLITNERRGTQESGDSNESVTVNGHG